MNELQLLIIDDDMVDRRAVQRALAQVGWSGGIAQAADAGEALAQAAAHPFDCILLDYHLPGANGLELLHTLQSELRLKTPIIMLTGEGSEMVAVEAMKRGAADYLPKSLLTPDSLYRCISLAVERSHLLAELAEAQALIERMALYDSLTSLGNRNLFMRDLARSVAGGQRGNPSFCLLCLDLNKFKAANDSYGHDAGDQVLAEIGRRFAAAARTNDLFYRQGGDEFAALVEAVDEEAVLPVVNRVLVAANIPIRYRDHAIAIGVSIGIAVYPRDGDTPDALLYAADAAMYRAKRAGAGFAFAGEETP